ncbi:MAG: hypothetical protein U0V64_00075 [Cyclobacteriaceae bacterium]
MKHILLAGLLLTGQLAVAQNQSSRWILSAGVGLSQLQLAGDGISEKSTVLSIPNIQIGRKLTPRLALVVNLPGCVYRYAAVGRTRDRGFEGIIPGIRYAINDRWWALAGIGLGMDAPAFYDIKTPEERNFHLGYAGLAGVGYEYWRTERKSAGVQLRWRHNWLKTAPTWTSGSALELLMTFTLYR